MNATSGTDDALRAARASRGEAVQPARWFHLEGTERQGPTGLAEVRELVLEGTLGPDSWVWADGMTDWMHVRDVPALVPPLALRSTLPAWPDERDEAVSDAEAAHDASGGASHAGPDDGLRDAAD